MKNIRSLRYIISLYALIFVVWGFYRFLFKLPESVEELFLKPIIWLLPLLFILKKERKDFRSLGWTTKNLFPALYLSIGLGVLFAVEGALVNSIKYGGSFNFLKVVPSQSLFFSAIGLSLVTAVSEETVFRGFMFNRLLAVLGEWRANLTTSVAWALVHLPITIFVFRYDPAGVLIFLFLTFLFGAASAFVFARTGNVLASVLLHIFWEWPIILFR